MSEPAYLPDVNVLVALADPTHVGHKSADTWRRRIGSARFLLCPVTESSFVRLMAIPSVGGISIAEAIELLKDIRALPRVEHLPITSSWLDLVAQFARRIQGHRQVTDALLLGLAIRNKATLVTLDRSITALAGSDFAAHLLTLV